MLKCATEDAVLISSFSRLSVCMPKKKASNLIINLFPFCFLKFFSKNQLIWSLMHGAESGLNDYPFVALDEVCPAHEIPLSPRSLSGVTFGCGATDQRDRWYPTQIPVLRYHDNAHRDHIPFETGEVALEV